MPADRLTQHEVGSPDPLGVDRSSRRGAVRSPTRTRYAVRSGVRAAAPTSGYLVRFSLGVTDNRKDGQPNFQGVFAQGPPARRFVYIDVGTYAGQKNTPWARRMIVPLQGLTWDLIRRAAGKP